MQDMDGTIPSGGSAIPDSILNPEFRILHSGFGPRA